MEADVVLTMAELAKRWKCGRPVILKAIKRGELAGFRIGTRAWRFRLDEIERYERRGQ